MPHTWTSTEGNGKRSSADASVATVSHGVELTQCSEGESGFPGCSEGKEFGRNAGNPGSIPGWGRSPGERNGYLLQYSCLENSMDRGAWRATVHTVGKNQT